MWFNGVIGDLINGVTGFFTERQKGENAEKMTDLEATKQMAGSWKDEYLLILFSLPLIGMFTSPFIDLIMADTYHNGDLLTASTQALHNLEGAPDWYINIVVMMVAVSFGYRKLINYRLNK
ncbi:TMhelix containing protein [Vibrio phage 1.034.X._10N.261.46.B7]|nr:TMhelix containing protein [Vibrio phage 1.034.X._10N.261.46.B7]